ncbi:MAG: SDR family NAD(P)-dependent oxidoreductase [Rhodospirillaceae bacterium]|nr:SDR family NAD(P)-dependent oxidoreductase [Rhodospirillaceae bacterium]
MRFKDQVVWITGASSGIGEGLAYGFAAEGAKLVLSARREDELKRVAAACNSADVLIVPFDMVDETAQGKAVEAVLAHFGHVDIMVQNAGISQRALAKDTDLAVDRRIMELDYFAVVGLTKKILPSMIARKAGHFVVTSSIAAKFGIPLRSAYCAAKYALHGFFETLAVECAPYNIGASLLVIAGVATKISQSALKGDGSTWNQIDDTQAKGMSITECARIVLNGVVRKDREINVLVPPTGFYVLLKRFFPGLLFRMMVRKTLAPFVKGQVGVKSGVER